MALGCERKRTMKINTNTVFAQAAVPMKGWIFASDFSKHKSICTIHLLLSKNTYTWIDGFNTKTLISLSVSHVHVRWDAVEIEIAVSDYLLKTNLVGACFYNKWQNCDSELNTGVRRKSKSNAVVAAAASFVIYWHFKHHSRPDASPVTRHRLHPSTQVKSLSARSGVRADSRHLCRT